MSVIPTKRLIQIGVQDFCNIYQIPDDLIQAYKQDLFGSKLLEKTTKNRNTMPTPYHDSGYGTVLNGVLLYCVVRYFNLQHVVETGVSGGYYTSYLIEALKKTGGMLVSLELSESPKVGQLMPLDIKGYDRWILHKGTDSLDYLRQSDMNFDLMVHDSLHTFDHMTKELNEFKRCKRDSFFMYFDDQEAEGFWDTSLRNRAFLKDGYEAIAFSGKHSRLGGHIGGWIRYQKI